MASRICLLYTQPMKRNLRNIYITVAIVVVALVFLDVSASIFRIYSVTPREWVAHTFAGKVSATSSDSVSVTDANGHMKLFLITPQTQVMKGKKEIGISKLPLGSYVIVHSEPQNEKTEEAREIRIITTSSFDGAVVAP